MGRRWAAEVLFAEESFPADRPQRRRLKSPIVWLPLSAPTPMLGAHLSRMHFFRQVLLRLQCLFDVRHSPVTHQKAAPSAARRGFAGVVTTEVT